MRVISGSARGMKLKAPKGEAVRPTADRVKEALFSILGPAVMGAETVDLFAGSGALGIEALSRGAAHCTFVEYKRSHLAVVRENLKQAAFLEQARILNVEAAAALKILRREGYRADLIFMDPPYLSGLIPVMLRLVAEARLLNEGGLVVIEHAARDSAWADEYPGCRQKRYGETVISFIGQQDLHAAAAEEENRTDGTDQV